MYSIPDGLFPKEELAVERWTMLCSQASELCKERDIHPSDFYPNQHSRSLTERTVGIALSNYRQAIGGKGTSRHYEYVDDIITKYGFYHWIQFKTDEEKAIHKWGRRLADGKRIASIFAVPLEAYYPNQRSLDPVEKEIGIALVNYRQALHDKGTHKVYASVTSLLTESCPHWIRISLSEKKCLDQWRKRYETMKRLAENGMIPVSSFRPSRQSRDKKEREIAVALAAYLQRPIYDSVNALLAPFTKITKA